MITGNPHVSVTRRYRFSAAHRLHVDHLPDDVNQKIFGKCNNPNGHGHDYTVFVTVTGGVDPHTGFLTDHDALDHVVQEKVVARFDHQHLNYDPVFGKMVTTGENLAKFIWGELVESIAPAQLEKIGLIETRDNYFEYRGERQNTKM